MDTKNRNLIVSAIMFFVGATYMFSDSASITANVVGSSDSTTGLTGIIGLIILIASGLFFLLSLTISNESLRGSSLGNVELERLVRRNDNRHDEIKSQTHARMDEQDLKEKYDAKHDAHEEVRPEQIKK
jgi:hypothetical protein